MGEGWVAPIDCSVQTAAAVGDPAFFFFLREGSALLTTPRRKCYRFRHDD